MIKFFAGALTVIIIYALGVDRVESGVRTVAAAVQEQAKRIEVKVRK